MNAANRSPRSNNLRMEDISHYEKQAANYKNSTTYIKMQDMYPLLRSFIEECKDEELIN